ncbi:MAG: 3-isopropylmalate dehydratase [Hyphomonadaceae bacterium]|nr:3-isopropylmalate dehydratase [Hyphomonadaceae bacterium]
MPDTMPTVIEGRAWIFDQDNIDTDLIFPLESLFGTQGGINNPGEVRKHALKGLDPDFAAKVEPGDIVIVGANFGCGSHREQAVTSLKHSGIGVVLAKSFSRIYHRNAVNLGMPLLEWADPIKKHVSDGDQLRIDLITGEAENQTRGHAFKVKPLAPILMNILSAGGLIEAVKSWGPDGDWTRLER